MCFAVACLQGARDSLKDKSKRIEELETQVAALTAHEKRIKSLEAREWQGIWSAENIYAKGAMVTHGGSVWHSNVDGNRARPALDPTTWTLVVKSGRDLR